MPERSVVVARAAVALLAESGPRGLTHRAVDTAAGLPQGSTANLYATRSALVAGVLTWLVNQERALVTAALAEGRNQPGTPESLVGLLSAGVQDTLAAGRVRFLARKALAAEALRSGEAAEQLRAATAQWWTFIGAELSRLGVADGEGQARLLLACIDGLVSDQLTWPDPDFQVDHILRLLVTGLVGNASDLPDQSSAPPNGTSR